MTKLIFTVFITGLVFLINAAVSNAIGIAALPAEIKVTAPEGEVVVARLTIQNPSREVAVFEVYPDDLESLITPIPSRFTLESAESRTIEVKFSSKQRGVFTTNLSILARPITDPLLGIGSGVKIPLSFTVNAPQKLALASLSSLFTLHSPLAFIVIALALAGIATYALRRALRKRTAERY